MFFTIHHLLVYFQDVPNIVLSVLGVGHHVVGGVLGGLEHMPLLGEQETVELACTIKQFDSKNITQQYVPVHFSEKLKQI